MASLEKQLRKICDHHRIDLVYAFGSRACEVREFLRNLRPIDKNTASDVDIGVKPSLTHKAMSVREKVEMAAEIEDLLGVGRVDLVLLSEADPFLSANIVRGERLFCRDPYAADEYELYILRRAGDLAPLEVERLGLIFAKERWPLLVFPGFGKLRNSEVAGVTRKTEQASGRRQDCMARQDGFRLTDHLFVDMHRHS